jgi:hypothetical protein
MNPRVTKVQPQADYRLKLTFSNGEVRDFDVKPYLGTGVFKELRDLDVFNSVRPVLGSIQWKNEADLCPDTLYELSVPVAPAKQKVLQVSESRAKYRSKRQ